MIPMSNTDLLESVGENFVMKEFPEDKQFTVIIITINLEQRDY
jgi:hypothetical protein